MLLKGNIVKVHVRKLIGRTEPTHRIIEAWRDRERHGETSKGGYALSGVLRTLLYKSRRWTDKSTLSPLTH
jgi:hypothetical protein